MRLGLERHKYAPEMNRALIMDKRCNVRGSIPAPYKTTITEARKLFSPIETPYLILDIESKYPQESGFAGLNRKGRFTVRDRAQALDLIRQSRNLGKAAILNDGREKPQSKVTYKIRLIG